MKIRTQRPLHVIKTTTCRTVAICALLLSSTTATAQEAFNHLLEQARSYEQSADYASAAGIYREYLLTQQPQSAAQRHARLKLPVLEEATKYGAGPEVKLYLQAMDARADANPQRADSLLTELIESYAGSALADDSWYLKAYISLMDNYDYQTAVERLQYLQVNYPESRYIDTALFAEAISHEQLGNSDTALATMTTLRDRHTGLSLAGFSIAKDQYASRLWFERSSKRIEYLQERADLATRILSMTPYDREEYQWQLELLVNQQYVTLLVNQNDVISNAVLKGNQSGQINSTVNAFAGIVAGDPDSWARVTIDNQNVRGMISTQGENHELLPVTSGGSLSDFHTLLLGDIDGNTSETPDHALIPPKSEDNVYNFLRTIKQADTQLTEGAVNQVAMIGVVIDSKYNDYYSGRGAEEALSILNTTDGIFRKQLGIALMVDTLVVIDDSNDDPMNLGSVTMETMMRNFRDYRLESADLGSDIGLATLFSGNKNSDSALGLAWIGSACRTDGFDVSVVTPYKYPSLLSTHEIGHTMGAPHDSDTSCASQNGHIMWPFLSSTSGRTFSSCSKSEIAEVMAANFCHVDAFDIALSLSDVNANSLTLDVSNQDSQRAIPDALVTITGPGVGNASAPANCSRLSADQLECHIGTITPLNSTLVGINFQSPLADSTQLTATVESVSFIDVNQQNNGFQTDIFGNLSSYVGLTGSSPLTQNDTRNSNSPAQTTPGTGAAGGGTMQPAHTAFLLLLFVIHGLTFVRTQYARRLIALTGADEKID